MSHKKEFPPLFTHRLKTIVPAGLISEVLRAYETGQPITGRVNTLKSSLKEVLKALAADRLVATSFDEIPNAFIITKGNFKRLTETDVYTQGSLYLQSLSSQIPPLVLAPKAGERVLDMCAAPGGKTTQLAMLMNNQGEVLACETDQLRFERLEANVKRQGATIVECKKLDARKLSPERNGLFDKILLDAPCSSEGTFSLQDPKTYAHWNLDFVDQMASLQKQLLVTAASLLKPGGCLVYSTCALSPEENESVLEHALEASSQMNVIAIDFKSSLLKPALSQWQKRSFKPGVALSRRVYPSVKAEGFYVAQLTKA